MAITIMEACKENITPDLVPTYIKEKGKWIWERKYDGGRHIWLGGNLVSKRGVIRNDRYPHIVKILRETCHEILDLEIYIEGGTVLDLNKRENWSNAKCCILDVHMAHHLIGRKEYLKLKCDELKAEAKKVIHLPLTFGTFEEGWDAVLKNGWEGLMMKRVDGYYEYNRTNNWLKIKHKSCMDVEIIKHEVGNTHGTFVIKTQDGVEGRVSGRSVDYVNDWKKNKWKKMEIEYLYLTSDGIPFQPVLLKFIE